VPIDPYIYRLALFTFYSLHLDPNHQSLWRHTISLAPADSTAQYNLGVELKLQGKLVEAIECYKNSVQVNPQEFQALGNWGSVVQAIGQLEYAQQQQQPQARQKMLESLEQAMALYDRALALKPDYADGHANRGVALQTMCPHRAEEGLAAQMNCMSDAIASYRLAATLQPIHANAWFNLGAALFGQAQAQGQIQAQQQQQQQQEVTAVSAGAGGGRTNTHAAISAFQRAAGIDPAHKQALQAIAQLQQHRVDLAGR
jgi:superkiller protein 3